MKPIGLNFKHNYCQLVIIKTTCVNLTPCAALMYSTVSKAGATTNALPVNRVNYIIVSITRSAVLVLALAKTEIRHFAQRTYGQFAFCPNISEVCPISTFSRNIFHNIKRVFAMVPMAINSLLTVNIYGVQFVSLDN